MNKQVLVVHEPEEVERRKEEKKDDPDTQRGKFSLFFLSFFPSLPFSFFLFLFLFSFFFFFFFLSFSFPQFK